MNMKINALLSIIIQAGVNEENAGNSFLNFTIQLCSHMFVSDYRECWHPVIHIIYCRVYNDIIIKVLT